jgi:pimeloyl-ACP methyl ester carboxylesterase
MSFEVPLLSLLLVAAAACPAFAVEPVDGFFTAHDGVKIHYLEAGKRTAPGAPVVLIHDASSSAKGGWFDNGIADALVGKHWVIAIDCRGHGRSGKPHDPSKYGPQTGRDVLELMDHLKIQKAHIGGYSMGGYITGQLLAAHPERFVTATFGGAGVYEFQPPWRNNVPPDIRANPKEADEEFEAREKLKAMPQDRQALNALRTYHWKPGEREKVEAIDLTKVKVPVLAINGEFDSPNAKTHRMQRELANFKNVVLPGKVHLTAIMPGFMPKEYIESLSAFIDANDPHP